MKFHPRRHGLGIIVVLVIIAGIVVTYLNMNNEAVEEKIADYEKIVLPRDFVKGELSTFDSIETRRSVRSYSVEPLTLQEVATLLYTTQGETADGFRAAPSAGALYPIETYIVVNNAEGLEKGVYHYLPEEHVLGVVKKGDYHQDMEAVCTGQVMCRDAPLVFVWTAVPKRTTKKYGPSAEPFIYIEAGHISQNLYLQANSMGMGVVAIGGFVEDLIDPLVGADGVDEKVIYINAVGKKV